MAIPVQAGRCLRSWRWLVLGLMLPLQVQALGLGEMEVHSALNEPLRATIALREIEGLSERQLLATLAPRDAFERAGIERTVLLSDLQFSPDFSDPGAPVLQVRSEQPVNEPFLSLVLEVRWPDGRLQREYTVLVDPPDYRVGEPARPRPAAPATVPTEAAAPADAPPPPAAAEAPEPPQARLQDDRFGPTDRYDTLWSIAARVRPDPAVSVQQTMLALHRLNPEAFVDGNINLLQAGYHLRLPEMAEIERLGRAAAAEQVAEHNAHWQQGTPGRVQEQAALRLVADPEPLADADGVEPAQADDERPGEQLAPAAAAQAQEPDRVLPDPESEARADQPAVLAAQVDALQQAVDRERSLREAAETLLTELRADMEQLRRQLQLQHELLTELQAGAEPASPALLERLAQWRGAAAALLLALLAAVLGWLRWRRRSAMAAEETHTAVQGSAVDESNAVDPLAAAEVDMAYGRFAAAARALQAAIAAEPQRIDLRLKHLEALAETGDADGFNEALKALEPASLEPHESDTLQALQARMAAAGLVPAAMAEGDGGGGDSTEEAGFVDPGGEATAAADGNISGSGGATAWSADGSDSSIAAGAGEAIAEGSRSTDEGQSTEVPDLDLDLEKAGVQVPPDLTSLDIDLDVEPLLDPDGAPQPQQGHGPDSPAPEAAAVASPDTDSTGADDLFDFDLDLLPADAADPDPDDSSAADSNEDDRAGAAADEVQASSSLSPGDDGVSPTAAEGTNTPDAEEMPLPDVEEVPFDLDLDLDSLDIEMPEEFSSGAGVTADKPVVSEPQEPELDLDLDEAPDEQLSAVADDAASEQLSVDRAIEPGAEDGTREDPVTAKLELAEAFLEHGDFRSARDYLEDVVKEGSSSQQEAARRLLERYRP